MDLRAQYRSIRWQLIARANSARSAVGHPQFSNIRSRTSQDSVIDSRLDPLTDNPLARVPDSVLENCRQDCENVMEAILKYGHDEDFEGFANSTFFATDAPAGSQEKIEILRRRVERGQPLWHDDDRVDFSGLSGVSFTPREKS